jgi:hypothetical protein
MSLFKKAKIQRIIQSFFLIIVALSSVLCIYSLTIKHPRILGNHVIETDSQGKILSWITPQANAYDTVVDISWDFIKNKVPIESCGYKGHIIS